MTRPLRIDVEDGWYHVSSRGIERRAIFQNEREHEYFLELLEAMVDRFRVRLHAHVELDNHYHLIVETPEANLSRAIQWLNVSYVIWVNKRRGRVGPLMQGRFKSIPVQDSSWAYELSLYVHLNPVMRKTYGLGKQEKRAESMGWTVPDAKTVTERLAQLRQYPWSSYRAYAGYAKAPDWLTTRELLNRASRKKDQRVKKYRMDIRQRMSKGVESSLKERLTDGLALGSEVFKEHIRSIGKGGREIADSDKLRAKVSFETAVELIADLKGEAYSEFMQRRGDWAKPLLLWTLRRYSGMTLKQIGERVGGMDYTAVAMAIKRFEQKAGKTRELSRLIGKVKAKCEL